MTIKAKVKIIGLTGTNAAGKGEAADYLVTKGYTYFSLSDIIRDVLREQGEEITRDNLIKTGNALREKSGADILAKKVMQKIKGISLAVIDSIRNPKEIEYLKKQPHFILLAINAPLKTRFLRAQARGRNESAASFQAFAAKEKEEMTHNAKAQQLLNCMALADFTIQNDGTLAEFHKKLEEVL